ncbi:MAG: sugar phosphate nucleotidyltransferase [Terrimicrobiaceae bacterium]|nr:sugar phosphate nucleotidyltransferase [Terrimicrobiaceae bacterium]
MNIAKALITAAGRNQRHLPLQTIVDREGYPRPVLTHLIEEAISAGIEKIGVVISPGDADLYERAAGPHAGSITFIEQPEPDGYGDAIHRGAGFLGSDPFLLMVSDHVYVSCDPERSCARQLVEIAAAERCAVSAVQATHESNISAFGTVGGRLFDGRSGLYRVERVVEKPTPTRAEQDLIVPGLRLGHYLCFLGMHVLTASVLETLDRLLSIAGNRRTVNLASALDDLDKRERYLAAEIAGRRFDLDERYGLLTAQLALALDGPRRAEILETVVSLLADVR